MSANSSYTVTFVPVADSNLVGNDDVYIELSQIDLNGQGTYSSCAAQCLTGGGLFSDPSGGAARFLDCMTTCGDKNCDPNFQIQIKVVKMPADLNYNLEATYGKLGTKSVGHDNYAKSFDVTLDEELSVRAHLSYARGEWEGNVYNHYGQLIPPPTLAYDSESRTFTWGGGKLVGTIRVTGVEDFDVWSLTIPPRIDSTEKDAWSSTIRAFYMDGDDPKLETLNVTEPEVDEECGQNYYTNTIINPDDDEDEDKDKEKCYKRTIVVDPCTGEIKSDTLDEVACPEEDEDEDN